MPRHPSRDENDRDDTGIEVSAEFFPLAFFLLFCTPRVEIDGEGQRRPWGKHFFPLDPGRHDLEVSYPYLFWSRCGHAAITFRLDPGEIRRFNYYHLALLVFLPGSLRPAGVVRQLARPGSSSVRLSLGLLLAFLVSPFFCCGAFSLFALFATQQGEADRVARQQAEADQVQRGKRLVGATAFVGKLEQNQLDQAHRNTTSAFRARLDLPTFTARVQEHNLPGAVFLRDDSRGPLAENTLAYLALQGEERTHRVVLSMAPEGEYWPVADFQVEPIPDLPREVVARQGASKAREVLGLLRKGMADSAYYQETSRDYQRRVSMPGFKGQFAGRLPLRDAGTPTEEKVERNPAGWTFRGRYTATDSQGQPITLSVLLRPRETLFKADEFTSD